MKIATGRSAKALLEPSFLIAVVVLSTAAFGIGPRLLRDAGPKLEVPLKRPLAQMDREKLGPYRFINQIPLSTAVAEALGTEEYIDWQFENTTTEGASDPTRTVRLTVSYYTGGRDLVPHVPDQCMIGAGYTAKIRDNLEIEVPSLGKTVPVRVLTFEKSAIMRHEKPTVAYFFVCNGDLVCTRNDVRLRMNSLSTRHAYFAKIEIGFGSERAIGRLASREESIAALPRFLDQVLPVLLKDHLPDWDEVLRQESAERERTD